jgi:4-amino-4-deoxy-L-arabinose transferase-like glycosyltransferase/DNA-binding beta-propeller fold protein YncE
VVWLEIAIALCLFGVFRLRSAGYDSPAGAFAWLVSILLLVVAFREKPASARGSSVASGERLSRTEVALFLLVVGWAVFLRFHRLGDWLGGIHGDEGEAGLDAMRVLRGEHVPPFGTGWFGQGNLYYWGVALGMKLAGTGLFGLRSFSALTGVLLLVPTYGLARRWFGARVALLSAAFLAISDVTINFSRLEFSNGTTPLSIAAGFAFFFRGLQRGRLLDFLLAGFAHAAGLYFYQGARLTPLLGLAFLGYLFVAWPLLTAVSAPGGLRGRAGRRGLRRRILRSRRLGVPALVYVLALLSFGAPFVAHSIDNRRQASERVKEKLVFNNEGRMAASHQVEHAPLFLGLRRPRAADALPVPIVFERTAFSVQVARDGFWPRVLWRQLVVTLSILTLRFDTSSVYTFAREPISKPFEAVLIVLSLAWTLARARDPRYGVLAIWFWGTVIVGGALTIDAPYVARLVGILPVLAISAALSLDMLAAALESALGRAGRRAGGLLVAGVLLALGRENFTDYFDRYTRSSPLPFAPTVGQAWFVRETNRGAPDEPASRPRYYALGAHKVYWSHSVNRFLNPAATGTDLANPSEALPLAVSADTDAIFMVWDHNKHYLPVLEALYPGGVVTPFFYGPFGRGDYLFTSYRVPAGALAKRHTTVATYEPAAGPAVSRIEPGFGTVDLPPPNLVYPVRARWKGAIFAPAFARYRFEIAGPSTASLVVDGVPALTGEQGGELVLARGPHEAELTAPLSAPDARVRLTWGVPALGTRGIERPFVANGRDGSLLGFVRALPPGESAAAFLGTPLFEGLPLLSARVDSFLGFQDASHALVVGGRPYVAVWKGRLREKPSGTAQFELHANGGALLVLDGRRVIRVPEDGPEDSGVQRELFLEPGSHEIEVWRSGGRDVGALELFWRPPGGSRRLLGLDDLEPATGTWRPGEIACDESVVPDLGETRVVRTGDDLDLSRVVREPRALAVTSEGELLVADTGGHRVVRLDSSGRFRDAFGRAGRGAGEFETLEDIAVGRNGRIYTLDSSRARVQVFSREGTLLRTLGEGAGLCTPAGFGLGPDGAVYVADTCGGRIVKLAGGGRGVVEIRPAPPEKLDQPVDVAVGPDGLLYVADLTPRLIALDPVSGAVRRRWPIPVGALAGGSNLALNGTRLYMSDPNRDVVHVIDLSGDELSLVRGDPSAPFSAPLAVASSPGNELYVCDRNGKRLQRFADPLAGTRR